MIHNIETIELTKIKLDIVELIDADIMGAKCGFDIRPDLPRIIQLRVKGYLMGDKHPDKVVKYPATWWDAFKEAKFPAWAKRRWPAKWAYERFTFVSLYPDFKPKLRPEESRYIIQSSDWKSIGPPHE